MPIRADLHIHSCLSPCASLDMSPRAIAHHARDAKLDLIALTDHNCARNCPAFQDACLKVGVQALFGIEVCSQEEVHLLCLFDSVDGALTFGEYIESHLPPILAIPEKTGDQVVVNEQEEILESVATYLGSATTLSIDEITERACASGIVIPSHIDRTAFGMIGQLGFMPAGPFCAVEVSRFCTQEQARMLCRGFPIVRNSDSHYLHEIGRCGTSIDTQGCSINELAAALQNNPIAYFETRSQTS